MDKIIMFIGLFILSIGACKKPPIQNGDESLEDIPYNPTTYQVQSPPGLPQMEMPTTNLMTTQGIKLGRFLFYDPILSRDSSISCGSCHKIEKAFTDGRATALGIEGKIGTRSSMSLINVGYFWKQNRQNNFMWDGKFATLEEQALAPIEHPLEMDFTWDEIIVRLKRHPHYPKLFREAFGIQYKSGITKELAAKAIAQFERTLNSADSRYDQTEGPAKIPFEYLSEQELRGLQLFLGDTDGSAPTKDGECAHCHTFTQNKSLFARNDFSNNGLDSTQSLNGFVDNGLGDIISDATANGKFREVTLRNIGLTAPYMHDGRFATLEEVLDHYATGGHPSPNLDNILETAPDLKSLTQTEKGDIIAFLHTLTDSSYFNKAEWKTPFDQANPWE
ncbi:MAG: cytochrome-c peroxidase [Aureispira sp.]|nr:cytochrome-c peroxidase [Aureispira sp.]